MQRTTTQRKGPGGDGTRRVFRPASRPDGSWSMIGKAFLNDPRLDWAAVGMLAYLLTRPYD